jgi:hypothetical protein
MKLARLSLCAVAAALYSSAALSSCVALDAPGRGARAALPPPTPRELRLEAALRGHVEELAGRIGVRNRARPGSLEEARDYIEWVWRRAGLEVRREPFTHARGSGVNLWVELGDPRRPLWIVSAHYDTVASSPGADDDASGMAVLLELPSLLGTPRDRVRLVAFDDEEQPAPHMGSTQHARALRADGRDMRGMLSLEMLGYYSDDARTQSYPIGALALWYGTRANFLSFVGDWDSRALLRRCVDAFRDASPLPCAGLAAPRALRDIGRSDHAQFWAIGVPALMVTDTSNFRYPHYHTAFDTPERLDYRRLCLAADGVAGVLRSLASSAP